MNVNVELTIAEAAIRENNRTWKHDVLLATQGDDGLIVNRPTLTTGAYARPEELAPDVNDAVVALALDLAVWGRQHGAKVTCERRSGTFFFWFKRTSVFR